MCVGKRFGGAKTHFFWLTAQSNAPYLAFSDQNDVWCGRKLDVLYRAVRDAELRFGSDTPILVFSDQTVTDDKLNTLSPSLMRYQKQYFEQFDYRSILMENVVTGGAILINRALAKLSLLCADTSQVIMHDWWMAAVAARFGEIVYMDEPLGAYRQHGSNSVGAKDVRSAGYVQRVLSNSANVKGALQRKKAQAAVFEQTYAALHHDADRAFLREFEKAHSGPLFYWKNRDLIHGSHRLIGMMLLG